MGIENGSGVLSFAVMGNYQRRVGNHQPVSVNIDDFVVSGHTEALAVATTVSQVRGNRREADWYRKWNDYGLIMSEWLC